APRARCRGQSLTGQSRRSGTPVPRPGRRAAGRGGGDAPALARRARGGTSDREVAGNVSARVTVQDAARNNALWCDAMARAHGRAGELAAAHWLCREPMPPFYPNLVTLDASQRALDDVRALRQSLPAGFGVKDSFSALSLERESFRLAFEAEWLGRSRTVFTKGPTLSWTR